MSEPAPIISSTLEEIEESERQEQIERNQEAIALLQSWIDDPEEWTEEDERL